MRIGDTIGQYRVTQLIGQGGMGEVYKAIDTMIEREVAIKVLRPEIARQKNLVERFRAEAVTLAKLNHPGIATLYSFMQEGDRYYMVLEYVPGKTLERIEQERGALDYKTAVPLLVRILEAMQSAHEMGIMHRDVKPANIMLTTWGTVKLMDFGIARALGAARQTREGALVGTMEYIAPERIKGKEGGPGADIYSLGIVLYEMMAGRLPFSNENEFELMRMQMENVPPAFAEMGVTIPVEIEAVVGKSMAKQEADRYATCEDFIAALQGAAGMTSITKRDIVALVGQTTVSELGTAGHSSSGETLGVSAGTSVAGSAWPETREREKPGKLPGSLAAFMRMRKVPLLVAAAAIAALGLGVGFGLMARRAQPKPVPVRATYQNGATSPSTPTSAGSFAPGQNGATTPPGSPVSISTPDQPTTPIKTQPVTLPTQPKPEPQHKMSLRERSLRALDQ